MAFQGEDMACQPSRTEAGLHNEDLSHWLLEQTVATASPGGPSVGKQGKMTLALLRTFLRVSHNFGMMNHPTYVCYLGVRAAHRISPRCAATMPGARGFGFVQASVGHTQLPECLHCST